MYEQLWNLWGILRSWINRWQVIWLNSEQFWSELLSAAQNCSELLSADQNCSVLVSNPDADQCWSILIVDSLIRTDQFWAELLSADQCWSEPVGQREVLDKVVVQDKRSIYYVRYPNLAIYRCLTMASGHSLPILYHSIRQKTRNTNSLTSTTAQPFCKRFCGASSRSVRLSERV